MERKLANGSVIRLVEGDITAERADAIVNAANTSLLGGGGVDGAIHRRGGPEILEECKKIRAARGDVACPTGEAVATTAGKLDAKRVIHTVGPVWRDGGSGEDERLASCYRNALRVAAEAGCRTIAFPSISTGAYRFPVDRAASIALRTVREEMERLPVDEVRFVLFRAADRKVYEQALERLDA
jgi:O-acetyl-ADP-ribose deacetylase (regulator of RNase III)